MSSTKVGKQLDDIFCKKPLKEPSVVAIPEAEKRNRGRPPLHTEEWTKVTVVLRDQQIHWLDRLSAEIRLKTKAAVSRAEILRALVAAAEQSGLDLTTAKSEKEITSFLVGLLTR